LIYHVRENEQIRSLFESICNEIETAGQQQEIKQKRMAMLRLYSDISKRKSPYSSQIRLYELRQLAASFEISIFSMLPINLSFILSAILFTLQYIVFLMQTN